MSNTAFIPNQVKKPKYEFSDVTNSLPLKASVSTVSLDETYTSSVSHDISELQELSLAKTLDVESPHNDFHFKKCNPFIIGHRGSLYCEPENTISSFARSHEDGAHGVEFDVFKLKCGTLVVFHGVGTDQDPGLLEGYCLPPSSDYVDDPLKCASSSLSIVDLDYSQVKNLRFDKFGREFACPIDRIEQERIPKLEDVLLLCKQKGLHATIELKGEGTSEPCLEMVDRLDMVDLVTFSSFKHEEIARIRELRPDLTSCGTSYRYRTGALFDDVPENFVELALSVGASEIHLCYDTCTSSNVKLIHAAGMASMAWFKSHTSMKRDAEENYLDVGNEDELMLATVLNSGVMKMCVNRPDLLSAMTKINSN